MRELARHAVSPAAAGGGSDVLEPGAGALAGADRPGAGRSRAPDRQTARTAARHYDEAIAFCEKLGAPPLGRALPPGGRRRWPGRMCAEPRRPCLRPRRRAELALGAAARGGNLGASPRAGGPAVRLRHSKGLGYLQYLIEQPGRQVHVLELAGVEHQTGDAGVVLDPRAKAEYRERLDDAGRAAGRGRALRRHHPGQPDRAGDRRPGRAAGGRGGAGRPRSAGGLRRRARCASTCSAG